MNNRPIPIHWEGEAPAEPRRQCNLLFFVFRIRRGSGGTSPSQTDQMHFRNLKNLRATYSNTFHK